MTTLMDRVRSALGIDHLEAEHELILRQLSEIERRQLETDVLVTELEARVAVLAQDRSDDDMA